MRLTNVHKAGAVVGGEDHPAGVGHPPVHGVVVLASPPPHLVTIPVHRPVDIVPEHRHPPEPRAIQVARQVRRRVPGPGVPLQHPLGGQQVAVLGDRGEFLPAEVLGRHVEPHVQQSPAVKAVPLGLLRDEDLDPRPLLRLLRGVGLQGGHQLLQLLVPLLAVLLTKGDQHRNILGSWDLVQSNLNHLVAIPVDVPVHRLAPKSGGAQGPRQSCTHIEHPDFHSAGPRARGQARK
mmetsp:Transcript_15535/g.39341  ORF Transcript_15535/g.39341 Transcript_15535/m.39341 type:complete len:235 (+) Transcript_15535:217-921(+)